MRVVPFLAAVLTAAPTDAQQIPDRLSCDGCRVQSSLVATLQHESIGQIRSITSDTRGRYWIINHVDLPTLFDSRGEFHSVVGRRGRGPAELSWPVAVWQLPGDSIAIVEIDGKVIVLDANLDYARTATLGVPREVRAAIVLRWPDNVIVNVEVPTSERSGFPLHRLDLTSTTGVIRESFGSAGTFTPEERFSAMRMALAPAADGGFWASRKGEYSITLWSTGLEAVQTHSRRPEWFSAFSTLRIGNHRTPPEPVLIGMEEDEAGRLWVYTRVPRADWRKAWLRVPEDVAEVPLSAIDEEYLYHTRIEVLDVNAARVVARHTLDRSAAGVLPGRRATFVLEDALGVPSIRVLQFTLSGI